MAVHVVSTLESYRKLGDVNSHDRREAWHELYEASHPSIFESFHAEGRSTTQLWEQAVADIPKVLKTLHDVEARAQRAVTRAAAALDQMGLTPMDPAELHPDEKGQTHSQRVPPAVGTSGAQDWTAVLLVGMRSANGWVSVLDSRPTLFLAVEMLPAPPFDDVLALHEAAHVVHWTRQMPSGSRSVAEELLGEGLAVSVTQRHRPDLSASAHLWFDDSHDAWVQQCESQAAHLRARCLGVLAQPVAAVEASMFSFGSDPGVPDRYGYWVGRDMLAHMQRSGLSLGDIMATDPSATADLLAPHLRR